MKIEVSRLLRPYKCNYFWQMYKSVQCCGGELALWTITDVLFVNVYGVNTLTMSSFEPLSIAEYEVGRGCALGSF